MTATDPTLDHKVVSREDWLAARTALLSEEKAYTRARDALSAKRRELPWVRIEKTYVFDTPQGRKTLAELFDGRSQLIIKHFMFGPDWKEGCIGCSFEMDHVQSALQHTEHHDVTVVAVSRAPIERLEAFRKRMGWHFNWVSSQGSDFNFDYHVSFTPEELAKGEATYNYRTTNPGIEELSGLSVFYKSPSGEIFHTYSTYGRGGEEVLTSYMLLDLTPKGRNETGPNGNLGDWVRHHDRYDALADADATERPQPQEEATSCGCATNESKSAAG